MTITISDAVNRKLGFSEADFLLELAIALFKEEKVTLGQASELAKLHQSQFQRVLGERRIPIHYDVTDLERDMDTLRRLERR